MNSQKNKKITPNTLLNIFIFIIVFTLLVAIFYSMLIFLNVNSDYASWLTSLVVLIFGFILSALIARAIRKYIELHGVKKEAGTISRLFSIIAYTTVIIIALYLMHINVTSLLISAGFLGLVLGLAAQSTLSNIFSGISMIIAKPFELGDYITVQTWQYNKIPSTYPHEEFIPGYSGIVSKIGLLYTEIKENNVLLYVPNSVLNQALVINYYRSEAKTLRVKVELSSSISFAELKNVIKSILKKQGIADEASIQIEHISQNTYGVSINYTSKNLNIKDELRMKEIIMEEILEFIRKQKAQKR